MVSDLYIDHLGPHGDGVHQEGRHRIYVERTAPGDRLKALVQTGADGVPRGEVQQLLESSPHRQKAPCPHYDRCGNCSLQHVSADFYRAWKTEMVKDAFRRVDLWPRQWLPTVFLSGQNRRRATFSAVKQRGQIRVGYFRRRSQEITDIDSCLVVDPKILAARSALRSYLPALLKEGTQADLFFQVLGSHLDMVITGPVGPAGKPDAGVQQSMAKLVASSAVARVSWRADEQAPVETLAGKLPMVAKFGELNVALPPASFMQPTLEGEQALVEAVLAALPTRGKFADLFSGCGTFAGQLLARGPVDAFEFAPRAVNALSKAAAGKPLKAFRRDLFRNPLRRDEVNRYDAVVFDPPRGGCPEQAVEMATAKTGVLVAVSCNPATLARDARILCEGGYWLQSVQAIDQFLYSHHVETVAVFTKKKRARR